MLKYISKSTTKKKKEKKEIIIGKGREGKAKQSKGKKDKKDYISKVIIPFCFVQLNIF